MGRRKAFISPIPPQKQQTFSSYDMIEELLVSFIISFLQIQFNNQPCLHSSIVVFDRFFTNKNAIKNTPFSEAVLTTINNLMKNETTSIGSLQKIII